ncbi:hypothetical protein FK220_006720 [Flavobacteriaceae bacterium TP-CH-4]|uniref:Uncharacterized protein n=1 Tax=Pelagihabitans pacificus TaxID=2696054 RepID=A0A967E5X0_9FLAO|nr:hypothetical protein [Pelagihabitans pacificus]NHF59025.1 hypothetical protein [Pelagihabitans pacificus]
MGDFETLLTGGHPNSLGNTIAVVETVLQQPERFEELFHCYFSDDEVVRLRVSNAMKRICKERCDLLVPYIGRFLDEITQIDQASTQWTLAQLFLVLEQHMNGQQLRKAKELLTHNLSHHNDWIVLNTTMETLTHWSKTDKRLKHWLVPHLERLSEDTRKSVSARATKMLVKLASILCIFKEIIPLYDF